MAYSRADEATFLAAGGYADTWKWNGTTWTSVGSTNLKNSSNAAGTWAGSQFSVFGGTVAGAETNDLQSWSSALGFWSTLSALGTKPPVRDAASLVYDTQHRTTVLFGGRDAFNSPVSDLWSLPTSSWSNLTPSGGPAARFGHVGVFDSARNVMVIVGGYTSASYTSITGETWEWDGDDWNGRTARACTVGIPVVPGRPSVSATPADGAITANWSAQDGGSAITGYTVTLTPGGTNFQTTQTTAQLTGLTNGTSYTVSVTATNSVGTSAAGTATATPRTVPGAPTAVTAVAGIRQATVSWTAPSSNGGSALTQYLVTGTTGVTTTTGATSVTFGGLPTDTTLAFTVVAVNAAGAGPASAPSNTITTSGDVAPGASGLMITPASVKADGLSAVTLTVFLGDSAGVGVFGQQVFLGASGPGNLLVPMAGTTDASGLFTARLTSVQPGVKSIQAKAGALTLSGQATFTSSWSCSTSPGFPQLPAIAVGTTPKMIVAADFNRDGHLDFATSNNGTNTVSIVLGNGDGTFQSAAAVTVGSGPWGLKAVDLNGDGLLDLAVANATSNTLSVLPGFGDGTFGPAATYAASAARGVASGDFNGDGILDLITVNAAAADLLVFLGVGDGTFQAGLVGNTGLSARAIDVGDFNADGRLDVMLGYSSSGQSASAVLLGAGDGTFVPKGTTFSTRGDADVGVADFNGDGRLDIAGVATSDFAIGLGVGDGTFPINSQLITSSFGPLSGTGSLSLNDVNGDGHPDAVVGMTDGSFGTYLWQGPSRPLYADGTSGVHDVATGDFNGDGLLDALLVDPIANDVNLAIGNGDGTFRAPRLFTNATRISDLVAADMDRDGLLDLVGIDITVSTVDVIIGRGASPPNGPVGTGNGATYLRGMTLADFNGDGWPDVATSNISSVSVLLNNRSGRLNSTTVYSSASCWFIGSADFNGDGAPDLACGSSGSASVLLNNGSGAFSASALQISLPGNASINGLTIADLNGDGKQDLILASAQASGLYVLIGKGDGTFLSAVGYEANISLGIPVVADFNGDGKLDVAALRSNSVDVLSGNGDGTLRAPTSWPLGATGLRLVTADLNGDGRMDLAATDYSVGSLSILLNESGGAFSPPIIEGAGNNPWGLVPGDFNSDGRLDLAVASDPANGTSGIVMFSNQCGP
jgi:hypothetical protein